MDPGPGRNQTGDADAELQRFRAAVAARLGLEAVGRDTGRGPGAADPATPDRISGRSSGSAKDAGLPDGRAAVLSMRIKALALKNPSAAALVARLAAFVPQLDRPSLAAADAIVERDDGPTALLALISLFADAGSVGADDAGRWREAVIAAMDRAGADTHDAVAIATAGLPLVWPFLPAFFDGLALLDGERFRDAAAQHRGAALLHHLATGEIAGPEQDLPLAKVLAGIDLDAVHDPGEPLDETEIDSAEALLQAMLGHAPMLGRISTAGLREAFLMRPGLLSTRDGHWLLRVERRGIDVLLDRLPWSFAWVRLPWMPAPLQVEW
jgi:hypothetical protein